MRPCKILITTSVLNRRGAERMILELAARLDRARFRPSVACLRAETPYLEEFRARGIEVRLFGMTGYFQLRPLREFYRFLRAERFDLVHTHLYRDAVYARPLGKLSGAAVVSTLHNSYVWRSRAQLRLDSFTARWADRLTAVSAAVKKFAVEREGIPADKIRVLHNGIETSRYRVEPGTREKMRELFGIGPDGFLIGSLGHLGEQKGFRYLIEAAPEILRAFPSSRFLIFGEGELGDDLRRRASSALPAGKFLFPGFRDDIPELLSAFDLFVLPSLWEGLPVVLIEAMAAGVPVVASDVDGNLEVTGGGEAGLGVPPADPAALAAAVKTLLGDRARREKLARAGRERARERFDLEVMVRNYQDLYREVLEQRSGPE